MTDAPLDRRIAELRDHFVVCAYGRVGRTVARELEAEGIPFVVVDRLEELEPQMRSDGVLYLIGDPSSESVLLDAGIERARAVIAAVDSDTDNVYITLTARALSPDVFIVGRASDPQASTALTRAGANRVVSPYASSGRHMAMVALHPRIVDYLDMIGRGERPFRLDELLVSDGSAMAGRTLGAICGTARPLLLRRVDGSVIPNPDPGEVANVGDLFVVLGEPGALVSVEGDGL